MTNDKTPTNATIDALYGRSVVDQSGNKIGEIGQVYLDDASGQPAWVTVKTGLFGRNETFVPFKGLETSGDQIRAPYTLSLIHISEPTRLHKVSRMPSSA